jgi:hypothetical protein
VLELFTTGGEIRRRSLAGLGRLVPLEETSRLKRRLCPRLHQGKNPLSKLSRQQRCPCHRSWRQVSQGRSSQGLEGLASRPDVDP